MGDTSFTPMYAFVSDYQFRPQSGRTFVEEETITPEREPRIDAVDDGLSDSMDEHSDWFEETRMYFWSWNVHNGNMYTKQDIL